MANIQHSTLTDPNLHEPKGISTASANTVYMANGSGSGTYTNVNRLPGTGWGQYSNAVYVSTTYLAISTTAVILPFDTNANVTQLPITLAGSTSPLMNLTNETLLFVSAGDMHSISIALRIATVSANPDHFDFTLYGSSDGTTYATRLGETTVPILKVTDQYVNVSSLFPVTADMVTHGARISVKTNAGTANIADINLISARVHKAR
jgi:hypothetical protein